MKLRILNGSHSTLAYLGALSGHRTIAEAVADDELREIATALIRDDMIPALQQPDGVDLVAYGDRVLARYANPGLRHTTVQIAMDGSQPTRPRWSTACWPSDRSSGPSSRSSAGGARSSSTTSGTFSPAAHRPSP